MTQPGPAIQVNISGPLFNGAAAGAVAQFLDEAKRRVAEQGLANVQLYLDQSIKHPTPYYETQILVQPLAQDMIVHDRGIVYGPWLEGVSHRNQATTFKGYHSFRRATQALRQRVPSLIAYILPHYLSRLGGH